MAVVWVDITKKRCLPVLFSLLLIHSWSSKMAPNESCLQYGQDCDLPLASRMWQNDPVLVLEAFTFVLL